MRKYRASLRDSEGAERGCRRFSWDNTLARPEWGTDPGPELAASGRADSSMVDRPVTGLSRNGGPFRPILSETRRKAAIFA
jgi:hypothetical protein